MQRYSPLIAYRARRMNFPEIIKKVFTIREVRVLDGIPLGLVETREVINKIKGR